VEIRHRVFVGLFVYVVIHPHLNNGAICLGPPSCPAGGADGIAKGSPYSAERAELYKTFGGTGFASPFSMPTIPTSSTFHLDGADMNVGWQQLDGVDCTGCTIRSKAVVYAGGHFRCDNCKIAPTTGTIILLGPAFNTLKFLQSAGVIPAPKPAEPQTNPNAPQLHKININSAEQTRKDWLAPVSMSR
jgi:hypothetical protein